MEQQQALTHWKKLVNPDYIGAYTIMDGTTDKELVVTIEKVVRQQVLGADGKKEECTVAYLKGQKPFILNATNQKLITSALGTPFIENWAGQKITLYVARVKAFGDTVDALRVRPKKPALPELTPASDRWQGAVMALKNGDTTIAAIKQNLILSAANEQLLNAAKDETI